MVMPSEWLAVVVGDSDVPWDSMEDATRVNALLLRFHNEIAGELHADPPTSVLIDQLSDGEDAIELADDWCTGYLAGMALREHEWREAAAEPALAPFFATHRSIASLDPFKQPAEHRAAVDGLPDGAVATAAWWRERLLASLRAGASAPPAGTVRRATPKISPNAPCTCGSGKKYKRCCSPLRVVN
jgi:uncharacterized protein